MTDRLQMKAREVAGWDAASGSRRDLAVDSTSIGTARGKYGRELPRLAGRRSLRSRFARFVFRRVEIRFGVSTSSATSDDVTSGRTGRRFPGSTLFIVYR